MNLPYLRTITEALPQDLKKALKIQNIKKHSLGYSLIFLVLSFLVLSVFAIISFISYGSMKEQWLRTSDNLAYWEEVAIKQENSPDAYYQAGFYAAELRDKAKALVYLEKALQLDPSFEKARELKEKLDTSN